MKNILIIITLQLALGWLFVRLVDQQPEPVSIDYHQALKLTDSSATAWIERGSTSEQEALDRFKRYWGSLSTDSINTLLTSVYAENVWFNDTVKTITNRAQLTEYMLRTASHVASCTVDVQDIAATDDGYYVRWVMTVVPKEAEAGEEWRSIGLTHLRINADGLVILHQDYWDSAGALYEHFPGIGWILRNIRARL